MQFLLLYLAIKATPDVEKFLSSAKLLFRTGVGKKNKAKPNKKLTTTISKKKARIMVRTASGKSFPTISTQTR